MIGNREKGCLQRILKKIDSPEDKIKVCLRILEELLEKNIDAPTNPLWIDADKEYQKIASNQRAAGKDTSEYQKTYSDISERARVSGARKSRREGSHRTPRSKPPRSQTRFRHRGTGYVDASSETLQYQDES